MSDSKDTAIATLVVLAMPVILGLIVIVTLPLALFYAWAAQKMYGWFLLPLHAPHLNLWHVYGITLLIGLFSASQVTEKNKKISDTLSAIVGKVIATFIVLLIGYLIKGHI